MLINFRKNWIVGSTNERTRNLIDHATSNVHKASMSNLMMEGSRAWDASVVHQPQSGIFLSSMDDGMRQRKAKKFDVSFLIEKESIPFMKCPTFLEVKYSHGVDLRPAYCTPDSAKLFTSYIAKSQYQTFLNKLSSARPS